jgi:hypothetical protein
MRWLRDQLNHQVPAGQIAHEFNAKFFGGRRMLDVRQVEELKLSFKNIDMPHESGVRANRCGIYGRH